MQEGELLEHLRSFVAFQTVAENAQDKERCLAWVAETFFGGKRSGVVSGAVNEAPYLLLPHKNPKLLWFAHVDVVPGSPEQFSLRREGDRAYGRGSNDMKGSALPFLLAYRDACSRGEDPPVSILLTSDEEVGGHSIPMLLKEGLLKAPVAFTPDAGGDPRLIVEHKGVVWAELRISGKSAHAAWPWRGENPVFRLGEALRILEEKFPKGSADDWHVTVTPAMLKGSDARNMIPDQVTCSLDIRFPPHLCPSPLHALECVRRELPDGCELVSCVEASPLQTDSTEPLVQLMKKIADEVLGSEVPLGRQHGASDARFFAEHGIPAFLYGPEGGEPHGREEWVSIRSMLQHYEVMKRLLERL